MGRGPNTEPNRGEITRGTRYLLNLQQQDGAVYHPFNLIADADNTRSITLNHSSRAKRKRALRRTRSWGETRAALAAVSKHTCPGLA
jgi:hypothetical protein